MFLHDSRRNIFLNPSHLNISMQIVHTLLHTFSKVLKRGICLAIKSFLTWSVIILFILVTLISD